MTRRKLAVLAITNLFGYPWDPNRGVFNQQQFNHLSEQVDLTVLVAAPWTQVLRHPKAYWQAKQFARERWPRIGQVDYFIFWYLPGFAHSLHSVFFLLSLMLQRPLLLLFKRWSALIGSWGFPDAVATTLIGQLSRTPVLMKIHGTDVNEYLHVPAKRWQILAAARRCKAVMTASAALRDQLLQAGLAAKQVQVIYNGIDAAQFKPQNSLSAQQQLGLVPDKKRLLFVGNLKKAKGCVDLLSAFITMAPKRPELELIFIGDGPMRASMQAQLVPSELTERVHFLGKLDHTQLPSWFNAADILCLPSHNEGVPNVVLEAMACGTPIVATAVGGIPEVVPAFAGVLCLAHDRSLLVSALEAALAQTWNNKAISKHAHHFSWPQNIEHVMALIHHTPAALTPLEPT
jgi:glycosyltransferase involved in cell wall biosynthesis